MGSIFFLSCGSLVPERIAEVFLHCHRDLHTLLGGLLDQGMFHARNSPASSLYVFFSPLQAISLPHGSIVS